MKLDFLGTITAKKERKRVAIFQGSISACAKYHQSGRTLMGETMDVAELTNPSIC